LIEPRHIKDFKRYQDYLKAVGSLSGLFSDNPRPLINYRTAEKLFNLQSGAKDVGRLDSSFDSKIEESPQLSLGVGVKTFTANSPKDSSTEKIAEFSNPAFVKALSAMTGKELAESLSEFRNMRVTSDALQLGINLEKSYYHCVVRVPGAVVIHEEPYELVKIEKLYPTDARGKRVKHWPNNAEGHLYFSDDLNLYTFHRGKNVLQKRFNLAEGFTSTPTTIGILPDAFERIFVAFGGGLDLSSELGALSQAPKDRPETDSVVLPLYSPGKMVVQARSGLNNWNAAGRKRKFGEAYIPVPSVVHSLKPGFFPDRDVSFTVALPTGQKISAKVCQEGSKALMSDPNTALFVWLFELIDGTLEQAEKRLPNKKPYTYQDLLKIGKDSVSLTKSSLPGVDYEMELVTVGSFETFLESSSRDSALDSPG
jgi:hypothetical protein